MSYKHSELNKKSLLIKVVLKNTRELNLVLKHLLQVIEYIDYKNDNLCVVNC